MDTELYAIVDFILNKADDSAVEVIIAALKKRGERPVGVGGLNPAGLARQTAHAIQEQVGGSLEQMRTMVRNMAVDIIRRQAPELEERQVAELLDAWVPEDGRSSVPAAEQSVPSDVLRQMVKQFVAYSTGAMSASEQQRLHEEIPDWTERYWERFPSDIRKLMQYFLKGNMAPGQFERQLEGLL